MSVALDLTKSAAAVLLQQINADLGTTWTLNQIVFGPVMQNADVDANLYEAAVTVSGVQGVGPSGTITYKYNRIDLGTIFGSGNNSYSVDGGITYAQLLANINAAVHLNLQLSVLPDNETNQLYVQGDITPPATMPFPVTGKTSVNFLLTADPNSLIYRNSALLTATTAMTSLAAAFAGKSSTGLVYTAS